MVASFLALIFFVSSVHLTEFPVNWLKSLFPFKAVYKRETVSMQLGFYMIIPYIATNAVAMLLVYLYVHAAYTRQREQQKPTEDAPKEIMMY